MQQLASKTWIALVAVIPLIVPSWSASALGNEPIPIKTAVMTSSAALRPQDVVLLPGNVLSGEVVDANGNPLAETHVSIFVGKQEVARGQTDQSGQFAIAVPRGGVYWLLSGESIALARTWSAQAAPPSATDRVTLTPVTIRTRIRGQSPDASGPWYAGNGPFGLSNLGAAAVVAGVATAIAVPVAISQNNNDNASSSRRTELNPASP